MQADSQPITHREIATLLRQGHRVGLLMRHAERPPISSNDPSFGSQLELTPAGVAAARSAGGILAVTSDISLYASPMRRCLQTAQSLAEGLGMAHIEIRKAEELGIRGFYYEDCREVQKSMQAQGYMDYMLEYLQKGMAPHSRPLPQATALMAAWLEERMHSQLNIFVSHDIFVASFLTGLKVRSYTAADWVGFLHSAALIHYPQRGWVCHPGTP